MAYRCPKSQDKLPPCHDLASARITLDAFRQSDHSTLRIFSYDGDVVIRFYRTDIITYGADGSLRLRGYPTIATSVVARHFLPSAVQMRSDGLTCLFGQGGDADDWHTQWAEAQITGRYARLTESDGVWSIDEDSVAASFSFLELDRRGARKLVKDYPFADFRTWLEMAPRHMNVQHAGEDIEESLRCLKARDFLGAAQCMPTVDVPNGFGAAKRMVGYRIRTVGSLVTPTSLQRMKDVLYARAGLLTRVEHKVMSLRAWEAATRRAAALEKAGVNSWGYV